MKLIIALLSLTMTSSLMAQEGVSEYGILGLSTNTGSTVFASNDNAQVGISPNWFYYNEDGFVNAGLVNYNLFSYVGISGNWRFAEVTADANNIAQGINDREANPELGFTFGTPGARVTYLHDVSGEHDGQELQLHLGNTLTTPFKRLSLTPYVEIDWRDKNLSQHLYGISAAESQASGLDSFNANSTFVYKAGLIGLYEITSDWVLFNQVRFEHHHSDSALVQRSLGWAVDIGIVYQFGG